MANNVIKRVWNQNRMVSIEDLKGMTFQAESGGHTFQISGVDDAGNTVELSGSVAGVFLRPDNTDVAITGSASGGVVSVTLPANCYDVPGRFGLTIFVTANGQKTAVYAAMGTVSRTSSGTVSPGTTADVVDLINRINAAVATIPASWTGLMADIAPAYSDAAVYPVGAYCYYNGDLYRCTTAITTAESWTAGHWTQAVLGNDVSDLKSAIRVDTMCALPVGYMSANYQNAKGTRRVKWMNTHLSIYNELSSGSVSAGEQSTAAASLTPGVSTTVNLADKKTAVMRLHYAHKMNTTEPLKLYLRCFKDDYSTGKEYAISLPGTEGDLSIDLLREPMRNSANVFSVKEYPNVFIRKISWEAHTATEAETVEVNIYGIYTETEDYVQSSSVAGNQFRFKPSYAHLFINTVSDAAADTYVPSQSEYDIEIAKRLGFDVIEVNTHILSDGEYICLHGASGKFGLEFVAATGSSYTDAQIQDTTITSVDLAWVRENVRYKAKYPRMQTAPLTLAEFLYACRRNHMVPLINWKSIDQVAIANEIMGVDNYVFYGANLQSRAMSKAMFATWNNLTTKDDIINWVKTVGTPCIVGVVNYSNFTIAQWKEIVEEVHALGGLMGLADGYMTPSQAQDLWDIGFDVSGALYSLNPSESGTVISADVGFDDFTVTDGTYADGQVTLAQDGTIIPAEPIMGTVFLSGMWLDVTFTGTISVSMGRFITHSETFTADASRTIHLSTYALNSAPTFEIKAGSGGAVVQNIVFKADKR